MKMSILARALIGALVGAAAMMCAPAMGQSLFMPFPANATSGNSRAVVGIDLTSVQNQIYNLQSTVGGITTGAIPVPSTGRGGFATMPGQAVSMIAWSGAGYYYWTNTSAYFQSTANTTPISSYGQSVTYEVPLGACIYGEGNNNPAWYAYDIQCPAGSGWVTAVSYGTVTSTSYN